MAPPIAGTTRINKHISLPPRTVEIVEEADVLVVGGGAAGVAAAVSAARCGLRVILAERNGFLGGTMTAATLGGICGMYSLVEGKPVQMVFGFAEEVHRLLERNGGTAGPQAWLKTASLPYDVFVLKVVLEQITYNAGCHVLYNCRVEEVSGEGAVILHTVVRGPGGIFGIRSNVVIDCSGDAEICHLAGAPTEFSPSTAQLPSAMFRMGGVDTRIATKLPRDRLHEMLESAVEAGFDLPRTAGGIYSVRDGIVHLNITKVALDGRAPDPFDANEMSWAESEGRRQVLLYLEAFRRFVPGFESAYILDTGNNVGIRESRKIVGDYVMTSDDIYGERKFDDAIAINCWPVEIHGAGRATEWGWLTPGGYCHIPFRSLIPQTLDNVLVAGRSLSADHTAQASLRVTANCFAMGEAAGLAASRASDGRFRAVDVQLLQKQLAAAGVVLNPAY